MLVRAQEVARRSKRYTCADEVHGECMQVRLVMCTKTTLSKFISKMLLLFLCLCAQITIPEMARKMNCFSDELFSSSLFHTRIRENRTRGHLPEGVDRQFVCLCQPMDGPGSQGLSRLAKFAFHLTHSSRPGRHTGEF